VDLRLKANRSNHSFSIDPPLRLRRKFREPVREIVKKKEYPRLMLIRSSQLRAGAEDSAFLLPSAAALTISPPPQVPHRDHRRTRRRDRRQRAGRQAADGDAARR
jgi:hypothetical protein